ncbi:MAG TPA: phosphoglycerate dehydrogenase [Bauldia sp.]|nr:phosphoglycerate dehydrogenase [Bauldia sp.]
MSGRILVTPRSLTASPGNSLSELEAAGFELVFSPAGRQPTEDELVGLVPGCVGWLAGVEPISARVFDAADRLKVISRNGTGIDSIDLDAAKRHGVRVMTAAGANAGAVAELAVALMLMGLRHLPESTASMREGRWVRREGRELGGATVGLVGCGAVGRAVARIVGSFGATVLAYDIAPDPMFRPANRFAWRGLDALVAESTVLSLHCPADPGGAPILDAARLSRLPSGAGVVNTARASLVDELALLAALDSGRLGFYATDVFDNEPPGLTPLVAHARVIAAPHIGGFTAEGGRAAVRVAVRNLIEALVDVSRRPAIGARVA